jgi:hypothetical protein
MATLERVEGRRIFTVMCQGGRRCVVYNAAEIGNPFDHQPDKWYFGPYPIPLGFRVGQPFDTADQAEIAARACPF